MVEGTLAGLAAGLVATGIARNKPGLPRVIRRAPRLEVQIDGMAADSALIDVVVVESDLDRRSRSLGALTSTGDRALPHQRLGDRYRKPGRGSLPEIMRQLRGCLDFGR